MLEFFHTILFVPIYNLLIFLVDILPGGDLGLAVVVATILVKLLLTPLQFSAIKTQRAIKEIDPELRALREKYKDDKEKQAREMFAIYKREGIKPFSSILLIFIQLPILITLFLVFHNQTLEVVDTTLLYSFVPVPESVSVLFLGLISIAGSSLVLAVLAAVTQFFQAQFAIQMPEKTENPSMSEEFGRAMALQARLVLPLIIGFVAFASGAIALYFITTNIIGILQEVVIRKLFPRVTKS